MTAGGSRRVERQDLARSVPNCVWLGLCVRSPSQPRKRPSSVVWTWALSSQLWKTIVLRGLHMCVCHHSHGNVQQGVAAVSLRDCAVRGSNQSDPRGLGKSDVDQESRFAARNAQFATSVERFLGFQHVWRHCLATPFLGF